MMRVKGIVAVVKPLLQEKYTSASILISVIFTVGYSNRALLIFQLRVRLLPSFLNSLL